MINWQRFGLDANYMGSDSLKSGIISTHTLMVYIMYFIA